MDGYERLGTIDGAEVWVRIVGEGQEILIERGSVTERLAMLLAVYQGREVWQREDGREFYVVGHTEEVDRMLMELIDVLISIRYAHPTMVQLKLGLTEEEATELREVLGG